MSSFAPKFCPTHLKIHVCELQNVFNKNKEIEEDIGAKVRRLHGTQTEEELKVEDKKREHLPGTLGDILEKAKQRIQEQKNIVGIDNVNEEIGQVVIESEIGDRMAALRAKMSGDSPLSSEEENLVPPITKKAIKKSSIKKETNSKNLSTNLVKKNANAKKATTTKENREKLFTKEETQELIQDAVKEALIQVGIIDEKSGKKKKDINIKKTSSSKAPISKNLQTKNNSQVNKTKKENNEK
ncbi:hypothetical protein [Spiroplasma taiwanense]|uniref:Uncharacterized protein n=1 Tax=Spiroplasma taiwanense CT-1 TaxID=1276220 RepID=S5MBT8_9MOLU|nr:hypothetical protein [Spiroplasma taiwanense]AGR41218.1 hypothetical protein STAIW_v1c05960 [Spiroplasma taiwanense CT-1]